jgi:hypothetical protein
MVQVLKMAWAEGSKGDWRFALAAGAGYRAQNASPPIIKSGPDTGEESSSKWGKQPGKSFDRRLR